MFFFNNILFYNSTSILFYNSTSILTESVLELQDFYTKALITLESWELVSKYFSSNDFITSSIITILSFVFLMLLIFLFTKNYNSSTSTSLNLIINKSASLFILILINFLLIIFLLNSNNLFVLYKTFIFFIVFIILFSLYTYSNNNTQNSSEFILLSFTIICLGLTIISNANDDFALFLICLEGFSLSLYIMATINRTFGGISAAIKYFTFGTLGSVLMLWGAVNIYEITKSLKSSIILEYINTLNSSMYLNSNELFLNKINWSFVLIILGFLIKLGAAPVHQWIPDVYAGVPMQVTAFYSIIVKFILFVLFFEWVYSFNTVKEIEYAAFLSIIIGCFGTIRQTEVKRFLAYSSITHTGYLLLGDLTSSYIYLLSYILVSLILFSVLLNTKINGKEIIYLSDLKFVGQSYSQWDRVILVIVLSSMAGLPPFAGFYGKMFVWVSLIEDMYIFNDLYSFLLLLLNLVTSLLIIFYYIRIIAILYVNDETKVFNIIDSGTKAYKLSQLQFVNNSNLNIKISQIAGITLVSFWTFIMPALLSLINLIN